jgi:hypothetical protein
MEFQCVTVPGQALMRQPLWVVTRKTTWPGSVIQAYRDDPPATS